MAREQVTRPFEMPIEAAIGHRIVRAVQHSGDFHSLDEGYVLDGTVEIELDDGTLLAITGLWCNDSTASTEVEVSRKDVG